MASDSDIIRFYGKKLPYYELSNFARYPIVVEGVEWPSTEHYFQGMKYDDPELREEVRLAPTPAKARALGRKRSRGPIRQDWDQVKDMVMYEALTAKFTQHEKLRDILLSTGNAVLVEASPTDYYWGSGKDDTGKNMLGLLLMVVREDLANQ
jgi:ribA/ribD-fused uncharacterized protein